MMRFLDTESVRHVSTRRVRLGRPDCACCVRRPVCRRSAISGKVDMQSRIQLSPVPVPSRARRALRR